MFVCSWFHWPTQSFLHICWPTEKMQQTHSTTDTPIIFYRLVCNVCKYKWFVVVVLLEMWPTLSYNSFMLHSNYIKQQYHWVIKNCKTCFSEWRGASICRSCITPENKLGSIKRLLIRQIEFCYFNFEKFASILFWVKYILSNSQGKAKLLFKLIIEWL